MPLKKISKLLALTPSSKNCLSVLPELIVKISCTVKHFGSK